MADHSAAAAVLAELMTFQTVCEVAGIGMSRTPRSQSASTKALITAGGEPIATTSPQAFTPQADGQPAPLLAAILDSRKGQAELSAALG